MPQATPLHLKHKRPESSLRGWVMAYDWLDRIEDDAQRKALCNLILNLGVQGAPGMDAAAKIAMHRTGLADFRGPKEALSEHDYRWIERRVCEERAKLDSALFPKFKRP